MYAWAAAMRSASVRTRMPGTQIRSMMVPVDSAPPAHMVISAVLLSVRSSSCSAVVISRLPVQPTGWPSAIAPPLTLTVSMSGRAPGPTTAPPTRTPR